LKTIQIANGIDHVYTDRQSLLVIGLTGRTGSGCTTVSKILNSPIEQLHLSKAKTIPKNNEERKYRIIRNWTKNHWVQFLQIQVSTVITYFIVKESFSEITDFVTQTLGKVYLDKIQIEITEANSILKKIKDIEDISSSSEPEIVEDAYNLFFKKLPNLTNEIKELLNDGKASEYTKLYQAVGDNIRSSGKAFSNEINVEGLFSIPNVIAKLIDIGKIYNKLHEVKNSYFVLDALRHPFEIRHLRKIIPSFYVFSVGTDESTRISRLHEHCSLTIEDIRELDLKEYPKRNDTLAEYPSFVSQNIQACVDLADVHLSNTGNTRNSDRSFLTSQIIRYVALMQHPGIVTPTIIERNMQVASVAKLNSGCISRQVGAVVTNSEGGILSIGWNDVPEGQVPCILRNTFIATQSGRDDPDAYSEFEKQNEEFKNYLENNLKGIKKKSCNGNNITFCFKDAYNQFGGKNNSNRISNNQVHTRSLHAEENAFLQIAKYGGQGVNGGALYTTSSPCELCAKKAYQLGIKKIYYIEPYPGISNSHVLSSGTILPEVILFNGAIGRAFDDLYNPIMPYKDELSALIYPLAKQS
jgi:dCMP deaminase